MHGIKAMSVALAATTLMGVSPVEFYSSAQLALLDPSTGMAGLCGGRDRGSMRAMLATAAAAVQADMPAAMPLYDGLGKIDFPITTANPLAQRY
ncbi:MAG: hypothetical protein Q8K85_22485, partial [Hyphomicrobium sp.]|nr:hypothetical protein [Hyphomicrobium sp.]